MGFEIESLQVKDDSESSVSVIKFQNHKPHLISLTHPFLQQSKREMKPEQYHNAIFFQVQVPFKFLFPSTIIEWNKLNISIHKSPSFEVCKKRILSFTRPPNISLYNACNIKVIMVLVGG